MSIYKYKGVRAHQTSDHFVFSFAATPREVLDFAEIERVGRGEDGQLKGFQRHQISGHIKEIRDYLKRDDALLPNAVIVAFIDGVKIKDLGNGIIDITINAKDKKHGFIVDGQQRLTALSGIDKPNFQVFVSALICKNYNELRQQFILINNTRPLPKTLIYELLPTVDGLPERFTVRSFAAKMVDKLNFTPNSNLLGEIRQHTNPAGVLSDTAMQKFIMNSASDGALRELIKEDDFEKKAYDLINNFFGAVIKVFKPEWVGMVPRTSRLKHGAGLVALGYVMEILYSTNGSTTLDEFTEGLELIKPYTAWTSGTWELEDNDKRPWNGVQNTPSDVYLLSKYLVKVTKKAARKLNKV
jgi:DGQHR domain-containing protein